MTTIGRATCIAIVTASTIGAMTARALELRVSQEPVRDAAARSSPSSATATISGVVVGGDETHQPVRRAVVTISGGDVAVYRSTITDDAGAFSIGDLPAGGFSLTATKPAYLRATYGASRPDQPGIPLSLADGAHLTNLTITMTRGGVISGTIRDLDGQPRESSRVSAFRQLPDQRFAAAVVADSDDRGQYRIFGLLPGAYIVVAAYKSSAMIELAAPSVDDVDATLSALEHQRTPDAVAATRSAPPPVSALTDVPVYFPGVSDAGAATLVRVAAGEERGDTDIAIQPARSARVSGVIVAPATAITHVKVTMRFDGPTLPIVTGQPTPDYDGQPQAAGPFSFHNVAPGHYVVWAQATDATSGPSSEPPAWWAAVDVQITGEDVSGLVLALKPTFSLHGRIVVDASTKATGTDLSKISIAMPRRDQFSAEAPDRIFAPPTFSQQSGAFSIEGVMPGTYGLSLQGIPAGLWVRSAMAGDHDLLDVPLRVDPRDVSLPEVLVTLSDRHTSLSGTLQMLSAPAASAYSIVVFPADRSLWLPNARRIRLARADTAGRYVFRDLPPGNYQLAAVTDMTSDNLVDSAFLENLTSAAVAVALGEGEQKTQDFSIGGEFPTLRLAFAKDQLDRASRDTQLPLPGERNRSGRHRLGDYSKSRAAAPPCTSGVRACR